MSTIPQTLFLEGVFLNDRMTLNQLFNEFEERENYYLKIKWVTDEEINKKENEMRILKFFQYPIKDRTSYESSPIVSKYGGINSLSVFFRASDTPFAGIITR